MIPSGPAALSEGTFLSCSLISSRVGRMLSCGSGMCVSEGWGASKSACTRMASSSSQGEGPRAFYIGGILVYKVRGLFGCGLGTTVFCLLTCLCAFVRAVAICLRSHWICSRGGVARLCSWWR